VAVARVRRWPPGDRFDHDDAAGDASAFRAQHDLGAAQAVEDLREVALAGPEASERRVGPRLRIERHGHAERFAASAIDDGQTLEQIVDLVASDLDPKRVAIDRAAAFEVADAVAVE